jgi:hypothetical protein
VRLPRRMSISRCVMRSIMIRDCTCRRIWVIKCLRGFGLVCGFRLLLLGYGAVLRYVVLEVTGNDVFTERKVFRSLVIANCSSVHWVTRNTVGWISRRSTLRLHVGNDGGTTAWYLNPPDYTLTD